MAKSGGGSERSTGQEGRAELIAVRMLNPPPILRVTGPLLPVLTKATIKTAFLPDGSDTHTPLASQTQRIPLTYIPSTATAPTGLRSKRLEKEEKKKRLREQASRYGFGQTLPFERRKMAEKERQALQEGLSFPGLWISEGIEKTKEFTLELTLGFPRDERLDVSSHPGRNPSSVVRDSIDAALPLEESGAQPAGASESIGQTVEHTVSSELFSHHHTLGDTSSNVAQEPMGGGAPTMDSVHPPSASGGGQPQAQTEHAEPPTPNTLEHDSWARFTSAPLNVVSKPSQKTAKARSMASCFTVDDSFSLWVRIHAQTVRTKYMKLDATGDEPHLTTRTGQWTPFRFQVTERAAAQEVSDRSTSSRKRGNAQLDNVLTYGSVGCLVDLQSGIMTEPMRLVKIEKNEHLVGTDYGHPVSDLQRVGFVRLVNGNDDYAGGGRWYLSAPGARMGGAEASNASSGSPRGAQGSDSNPPEDFDPQTLESVADPSALPPLTAGKQRKRKTKRFALAEAVIAEDAGGAEFSLTWTKASRYEADRMRISGKERIMRLELCEKVEDWMCWTLGGVGKSLFPRESRYRVADHLVDSFTHSFFDGTQSAETETLPATPIDPVPRSLRPPAFDFETNTLELTLSDFIAMDALADAQKYEVFLGPLGPLSTSIYHSRAPVNAGADDGTTAHFEAVPYFDVQSSIPYRSVRSDYPCNRPHAIVVVDMPRAEEIIRAMQECYAEAQYQGTSTLHTVSGESIEADGWLNTSEPIPQPEAEFKTLSGPSGQPDRSGDDNGVSAKRSNQDGGNEGEQALSAGDLGEAHLGLEQMLTASHGEEHVTDQHQHDVDDIAAVLAAHASENDFSLSQIDDAFLTSNLDPSLHDPHPIPEHSGGNTLTVPPKTETHTSQGAVEPLSAGHGVSAETSTSDPETPPPPLRLSKPEQEDKKVEMVPLPVLLIRKADGVGFGVGRSVVAERVDSKAPGEKASWGESCALMGE